MTKELITKEEAEVLNQDDINVLKILKQNSDLTYRQLAMKVFKARDVFTMSHTYSVVGRLRKKLGLPFYPFNGPNSVIKLPRTYKDAESVVSYVGRRALGGVKAYVRTLKYVDKHVEGGRKLVDKKVGELEEQIIIK